MSSTSLSNCVAYKEAQLSHSIQIFINQILIMFLQYMSGNFLWDRLFKRHGQKTFFIVCMSYWPKGIESCLFWKQVVRKVCQSCLQETHVFWIECLHLPNVRLEADLQESMIWRWLHHFHWHYTVIPPMQLWHWRINTSIFAVTADQCWLLFTLNGNTHVKTSVVWWFTQHCSMKCPWPGIPNSCCTGSG